ncbi:hypothetical protein HY408_00595 [Candidatus Gottesmanbacteria bacterium]|nr:hypothetical protein [Candidatus Gottesmanbacteria bacterium]
MRKTIYTYKNGFTIIEILITLFLFTTVVGLVVSLSILFFSNVTFSFEEQQSIELAQNSLTLLVREIREMRISENGAWPLIETNDNTLAFYSDVTNDGRTDRVRFFLEDSVLKRGVIEPTSTAVTYPIENEKVTIITSKVDNVSKPFFTYYNGSWPSDTVNNPLAPENRLLDTRLITIYLRINVSNTNAVDAYELTSSVHLRNLKNNL